jgi:hypothetical protein
MRVNSINSKRKLLNDKTPQKASIVQKSKDNPIFKTAAYSKTQSSRSPLIAPTARPLKSILKKESMELLNKRVNK